MQYIILKHRKKQALTFNLRPYSQKSLDYCISTTCNFTPTGAINFLDTLLLKESQARS